MGWASQPFYHPGSIRVILLRWVPIRKSGPLPSLHQPSLAVDSPDWKQRRMEGTFANNFYVSGQTSAVQRFLSKVWCQRGISDCWLKIISIMAVCETVFISCANALRVCPDTLCCWDVIRLPLIGTSDDSESYKKFQLLKMSERSHVFKLNIGCFLEQAAY